MATTSPPAHLAHPPHHTPPALPTTSTPLAKYALTALLVVLFGVAVGYLVSFSSNNHLSTQQTLAAEDTSNNPITTAIEPEELILTDYPKPNTNDSALLQEAIDIDIALPNIDDIDYTETLAFAAPTIPDIAPSPIILKRTPTIKPEEKTQPIEPKPANTLNTLQPYGNLRWDDDLLTTLKKVQAIENLDTIKLTWGRHTHNIKKPINTPDELQALLRTRSTSYGSLGFGSFGSSIPNTSSSSYNPQPIQGIDKKVVTSAPTITASPIVIGKGVFILSVGFVSEPGSILTTPDKALKQAKQAFGSTANFYCPLRLSLTSLHLSENTTTTKLDNEASRAIAKIMFGQLTKKYPDITCKSSHTSYSETARWRDTTKHQLELRGENSSWRNPKPSVTLKYSNCPIDFKSRLLAHQKKIVEQAHQRKFADKKDQRSKL